MYVLLNFFDNNWIYSTTKTAGLESQTGSVESTYSIAEGELLAPRASLSAIVFCVFRICMILKLEKKILIQQNFSMCVVKAD